MMSLFEQDRVIVRLQQRVMGDAGIQVCFLSGSFGRRTEDGYSDLDVALVFADELTRESAWRERREFVKSVTPYVPCKSHDAGEKRPFLHTALYSNGTKAEYRYETRDSLQPNPWDRDLRLLKDDGGWGAAYQARCAQTALTRPHISGADLTALDERFWVLFWDVYRQVLRGDRDKPFPVYLELLQTTLPPLLRILPPEDPAYQNLLTAYYTQDMAATAAHLRQLLAAYLAARAAIVRRLNLPFNPDTAFESQLQRVLERTKK
jgi:hypothetical protein